MNKSIKWFPQIAFLILTFWSTSALSTQDFETSVEGVWLEAIRGCDLSLTDEEIRGLHSSGGNTYFARTIFILNGDKFEIEVFSGDGCFEKNADSRSVGFGNGTELVCGESARNSGEFFNIRENFFYFEAVSVGGHSYGSSIQDINLEIIGGVLKVSNSGLNCRNLVKYFIPYPMS